MPKKTKNAHNVGSKKTAPLSKEQIDFLLQEFGDRGDWRMQIIIHFIFRIIRIGDIVWSCHQDKKKKAPTLTIGHVYNSDGTIKEKMEFREEKTNKLRIVPLKGESLLNALSKHWESLKTLKMDAPLFYGNRGEPLTDSGVKFILQQFKGRRGISQVSPTTIRKTGCRYLYDQNCRIEAIANVCNHHSTRVTETYISITPHDIASTMELLAI